MRSRSTESSRLSSASSSDIRRSLRGSGNGAPRRGALRPDGRLDQAIAPAADVGRHVDHPGSTFDLLYRAEWSYAEMARTCDFIKPILYHDIAGPRLRHWYLDRLQKTILSRALARAVDRALLLHQRLRSGRRSRASTSWRGEASLRITSTARPRSASTRSREERKSTPGSESTFPGIIRTPFRAIPRMFTKL